MSKLSPRHDKANHEHDWRYVHAQIQGRTPSETVVLRYCACGTRQMAHANDWRKAAGAYAQDEHYEHG